MDDDTLQAGIVTTKIRAGDTVKNEGMLRNSDDIKGIRECRANVLKEIKKRKGETKG